MSKLAIAAAFGALLFTAAPAFAQDGAPAAGPTHVKSFPGTTPAARGHVKVFDGVTGAEARNNPCRRPGFDGPHGSATNLRDRPSSDPTEAKPTRRPGFEGPHGSATNLRDRPSGDPTEANGVVKHGAGTLTYAKPEGGESAMLLPAVQKVREAASRSKSTSCR